MPIAKSVVDTLGEPAGPGQPGLRQGRHGVQAPAVRRGRRRSADYPLPIVYQLKLEVAGHDFTSSLVQPIDSNGHNVVPPGTGNARPRNLPTSTIYGFNGTFPGPMINFEYTRPAIVRFENHLDVDNGFDRQDFGPPNRSFITHLHNGHTAVRVRRQPGAGLPPLQPARARRPRGRLRARGVGGQPVPRLPRGRRRPRDPVVLLVPRPRPRLHVVQRVPRHGRHHAAVRPEGRPRRRDRPQRAAAAGPRAPTTPTARSTSTTTSRWSSTTRALDDGVTPHKDAHTGTGESHPEWWGKTYFRHLPNHGFVGDIFTVNGKAFPVLEVKRRKYRLRFLDASISRIYEFELMHSSRGPKAARDLGYSGDELQGQYRLPDGTQCMRFAQIASEGGLLPQPIVRDSLRAVAGQAPRVGRRLHEVHGRHADQEGRRDLPRRHDEDDDGPHVGLQGPQLQDPGPEDRHRRRPRPSRT